jgi:flagellar hook assembly protein FlgD
MGREVESLADGIQTSGVHSVIWKGTNMIGNESASGIYFYNILYNGKSITKKLVLLR